MKKALLSSDVMGYPFNEVGNFILDIDASDIGIGGILHQVQEDRERVIAYASRFLNKAEKNYYIAETEQYFQRTLQNAGGKKNKNECQKSPRQWTC